MRKNCSSDGEKVLKFEAEGLEFAKKNTVKDLYDFEAEIFHNFLEVSQIYYSRTIQIIIGKYSWD